MKLHKFLLIIGILLCSTNLGASGGFVVITSTSESVTPGAIVAAGEIVELQPNQKLKLLAASGQLIELIGPYRAQIVGQQTGADDGLLKSLARVVEAAHSSELTLAVFRNSNYGGEKPRGDIWGVDIGESGIYCRRDDQPLLIWWGESVKGATIRLENKTRSQTVEFRWKSRGKQKRWPQEISIAEGDAYRAKVDLSAKTTEFGVTLIPPELDNDIARLVWMSDKGCKLQSLRLLGDLVNRGPN